MNALAIAGAGSWGSALAIALAPNFDRVRLWVHNPDLAASMAASRENAAYLPGFRLPANVEPVSGLGDALSGAGIVIGAMPSRFARAVYSRMLPYAAPGMLFVSATKGFERGSLLRMSEVIEDVLLPSFEPRLAALSGPTFAREVARGEPAAVVIASSSHELALSIQRAFSGPSLRLYASDDPVGVEVGSALKNVIAIAAGICHGLGLGNNSIAALIARGLAEITRLAIAMGGKPKTLAGLAGLGDLVLTCTGSLSRNRGVGIELARGRSLAAITASMTMIAEGVETTASAVELARKFHVDMPISEQMRRILEGTLPPPEAIRELMERRLTDE